MLEHPPLVSLPHLTGAKSEVTDPRLKSVQDARLLLDEINSAISTYDPVLREQARDILLGVAFGRLGSPRQDPTPSPNSQTDAGQSDGGPISHDFATLVEKFSPKTHAERALLAGYFLTKSTGEPHLKSQFMNKVLKDHGIPVGHITDALQELIDAQPALVMQVKKQGTTKQARKLYKLTTTGIQQVETRLNATAQSA